MRRPLFVVAAAMVAAFIVIAATIPAPRLALAISPSDGTVAGVLHIHSVRSDGRGTPEEIAAAAARAGMRFLVLADHGDATRPPDPPIYRSGVLCLDGVEISTTGGHYVVIGMPAAPYPLAGEARNVVEDVRRLGGFGIVAHPDSPKPALRWRDWAAPFDAIELINLDTSWRVHAQSPSWLQRLELLSSLLDYPFRSPETVARLIEGTVSPQRWEILGQRRRVVAIAGLDAHSKLALFSGDAGDARYSLPFPGYETMFRTLSVHVLPDRPFGGDAAADAATLVRAIRAGHLYAAIDGLAGPPSFELSATNGSGSAREGDELSAAGPVSVSIRSNAPPGFHTIVRDGDRVVASGDRELTVVLPDQPAVYWAEVRSEHSPWIISNPIYVRARDSSARLPERVRPVESRAIFDRTVGLGWTTESDASSKASRNVSGAGDGTQLRFSYSLGASGAEGQFAALAVDVPSGIGTSSRLAFMASADRPMRLSVQLRKPAEGGQAPQSWGRSVFLDQSSQERTVLFDELLPVGSRTPTTWAPPLSEIRTILFVVDTTNTRPGSSGSLTLTNVELQK